MEEDEKTPESKKSAVDVLKTPPPKEHTTNRGREFEFGKPALKHRNTIVKVLKIIQTPAADYDAIVECAKARGMDVEDFLKLEEKEYTEDEMRAIVKDSTSDGTIKYADMMNDILAEVLYATIKKAPFKFDTVDEFETGMDDYGEAVELFPIGVKWVALAAMDIRNIDRKNL